jgi:prevent-host-death family protein
MDMAKSVQNQRVEVGVRELKSKLSHYIDLVQHGSEVIVTEHGKPVVKLVSLDASNQRMQQLIDEGRIKPPLDATRPRPKPIKIDGSMSELLIEMRGE